MSYYEKEKQKKEKLQEQGYVFIEKFGGSAPAEKLANTYRQQGYCTKVIHSTLVVVSDVIELPFYEVWVKEKEAKI